MKKTRTPWGIGLIWGLISFAYSIIVLSISNYLFPSLTFCMPYNLNYITGILLICAGVIIYIISMISFKTAYNKKQLVTTGIYGIVRHPLYSSIILFIVPGVLMFIGSIIGLTIPLFMYIVFIKMIHKEEAELEKEFEPMYFEYKKRTGAIIPKCKK